MVILSIGAPLAVAARVLTARARGSDQSAAGELIDTGLTRSRVASRSASSAPKNSVNARMAPVHDAKRRKIAAGNPIHRCHFRQNNRVTQRSPGKCDNVYSIARTRDRGIAGGGAPPIEWPRMARV